MWGASGKRTEGNECPHPVIAALKHRNACAACCLSCPLVWINTQLSETSIAFLTFLRAHKWLQALSSTRPFLFIWVIDPAALTSVSVPATSSLSSCEGYFRKYLSWKGSKKFLRRGMCKHDPTQRVNLAGWMKERAHQGLIPSVQSSKPRRREDLVNLGLHGWCTYLVI